ncbi:MAG: hypothetical protein JNM14_01175 [Ferruginibacter sp.]|nr:hypothetical protein [Ferruginibacter sp.]
MTISINHVNRIDVCKDLWDGFLPAMHHLSSRHLQALENAQIPDIETYYLQVFLKDKLIGLAYLQLFKLSHTHLNFSDAQGFQSTMVKTLLPKNLRLLVCGNLFRINFQGFYFKNEQHNAYIFDAIEYFAKKCREAKSCAVIIKDCKEVFPEGKHNTSYRFFNGDVTMEITRRKNWNSFDDYLNDLTKKYHKRAKKIIQAFKDVETREWDTADILANAADIERLYWNVINKQKVRIGIINAAYLHQLKLDLGDRFEIHALYLNGVMIGFYTYIFYETEMETHYIGLDYTHNDSHKTYFNILFLSVQKMIERKYERLELGRTAKEAKANLGAFPKQIFNYVKITSPVARIALNYFLKRFNRSENQKQLERSPLK